MKLLAAIASVAVIGGIHALDETIQVKASTVQCSALARNFSNGDINFNPNLKCREGSREMTYGQWCSRTQGVICTTGRGWQ